MLYRIDADGSNPTLIGDPDAFDYEPKISPDGTEVLFQRWFGDGQAAPLLVADLATGEERTVMESGGLNPAWSPDGSRIVMQTDPSGAGIWGPLITITADGDPASEVELYPGGAERGGFKPAYSPDGSRVAFGCGSGAGTDDYDEAICVVDADGRRRRGARRHRRGLGERGRLGRGSGVVGPHKLAAAEPFDELTEVPDPRSLPRPKPQATPDADQRVDGITDETGSQTVKAAEIQCTGGRRLVGAGAAITNTAPGNVSLQRSLPYSSDVYNSASARAVENSTLDGPWDFIVAQAICVREG